MSVISNNNNSLISTNPVIKLTKCKRRSIDAKSFEAVQHTLTPTPAASISNHHTKGILISKTPSQSKSTLSRNQLPLSRSKSLDKRDLAINPPLPRFGHSMIAKQPPIIRPSLQSRSSFSLNAGSMSSEEMSKERILRCRNRKALMKIPPFQVNHAIVELEHRFVRTKPLLSYKRKLLKQGTMIKDNGANASPRRFFLFTDILVYGAILPEHKSKACGKDLYKQITVSLGNLWIENCEEATFSIWMTTEKEHFKVIFQSSQEKDDWIQAINITLKEYRNRPNTRAIELQEKGSSESLTSNMAQFFKALSMPGSPVINSLRNWTIGRKMSAASFTSDESGSSISWVPDHHAERCMVCNDTKFSILVRRHHCRVCGYVICFKCSTSHLTDSKIRCCTLCYKKSLSESCDIEVNRSSDFKAKSISPSPVRNLPVRMMSNDSITSPLPSDKTLMPRSSPLSSGSLSDSGSDRTYSSQPNSNIGHPLRHSISSPLNPANSSKIS